MKRYEIPLKNHQKEFEKIYSSLNWVGWIPLYEQLKSHDPHKLIMTTIFINWIVSKEREKKLVYNTPPIMFICIFISVSSFFSIGL